MKKIAKITTTIFELIKSELINSGKSEFNTNNNIVFFDDKFAFIKKIMRYDNDVEEIVNRIFFQNEKLSDEKADKEFKKTFVNRFLNRQISRQTLEGFSSQVLYTFFINYDLLDKYYMEIDKYLSGENVTESKGNSTKMNDNRMLTSTLPQSQVNMNVDNTEMEYADTNTINRSKDEGNNSNQGKSNTYNMDNLIKVKGLLENIFDDFDKNCFLQIF